jgi:hypothetical protein
MAMAMTLRDKHGTTSSWIAQRMGIRSAAYLRKLLASA